MMNRAIAAEEDYFRHQEAERRREEAWDNLQRAADADRAEHRRLHALQIMLCPKCKTELHTRTLRGIEVQRCASCAGTWLTDGKLEALSQTRPGPFRRFMMALRGAR